ncbi:MAG TPA: isoprenylcysteine carboxylmethyltransferase family protein [Thermodesulfobacteriota bacterium]|nr:isoprenylcysteine carboxylmethyltransferase family protein [Thermodesulfobacteriota bacterium]
MNIDFKSIVLVAIQLVCIVFILATGRLIPHSLPLQIVYVLAIALGLWALWTINFKNFRLTPNFPKDARIVAKGPYKLVRHPMYSCLLLVTLMLVIDDFSIIRFAVWLILLADLYVKLVYEEKLIIYRNSDYQIYKRGTKRLIPFIH